MTTRGGKRSSGLTRRGALAAFGGGAAMAACAAPNRATAYDGVIAFRHGVASGDPGLDRVVLWTRITPSADGPDASKPVPVRWVVASDKGLRNTVAEGEVSTSAARDFTVKVDAGGLKPGKRYWYGFFAGAAASPVGRTRTLPKDATRAAKFAVVSCSNLPFGFFNAYAEVAGVKDLDAVLHLGDYIYEYGLGGYGSDVAQKIGRSFVPPTEILTLADYRARHAQYKEDADLQNAHAAAPWIVVWDDHELTNDSWMHGAENHNPEKGEGDFDARKRAALQAYYEWMPIREPVAGRPFEAINRSFQWGDLVTIAMLETRLLARSQPLDYAKDLQPVATAWDFANPAAPVPILPGAALTPTVRMLPTPFDVTGGAPRPVLDWARASTFDPRNPPPGIVFLPDVEGFKTTRLADPSRALLGAEQEGWLKAQLVQSKKAGVPWRLLGNQVLMVRATAPDLTQLPAQTLAALEKVAPDIRSFAQLTRFGVPLNLDSWDGYPAQRQRLYEMLAEVGGTVVVTGDTHTAWANELHTDDGKTRVAAEFGATSITSPGLGDLAPGFDVGQAIAAKNPEVKWTDQLNRGFLVLSFTPEKATAEFFKVSTVLSKDYTAERAAAFSVSPTETGVSEITAVKS